LRSLQPAVALPEGHTDSNRSVAVADGDPDRQTLLFRYPAESRSDHWPAVEAMVTSFAAAEFPGAFKETACTVKVLAAAGNDLR
jgi:hypothetical protein